MKSRFSPLPEKEKRYAVYTYHFSTVKSGMCSRSFIVVKNGYGVIVRFTRFHEYVGNTGRMVFPVTADYETKLYYVVSMLNYILVDNGTENKIRHVFEITKPMLQSFFEWYATEEQKDGTFRKWETIEICIETVTRFMKKLCQRFCGYLHITEDELYENRYIRNRTGMHSVYKMPAFHVYGTPVSKKMFRDIPEKIMEVLLPMAFEFAADIAFGMCLQAFAGLRAGEVCNVRQENSPLGPGIRFTRIGNRIKKAEIDLRQELNLRSDGKSVGRIKKERIQCVYPAFYTAFDRAYSSHKAWLDNHSFEKAYAPMFVNNNGKAMTYETYRQKFKSLIKNHLRPFLLKSQDPELHLYGQLLYENELSTHALRHWYTVTLVRNGENIAGIQFWRGDRSPESAFTYLRDKGDLLNDTQKAGEQLMNTLLETGGSGYAK